MQILIKLHYLVNGIKNLQRGYFKVNVLKYKKNPDEEAARVACVWFREVKQDFIYDVKLNKVLYFEKDITSIVNLYEENRKI